MSAKGYSAVSVRPLPDDIVKVITDYGTNPLKASRLVTWVKLTSGAGLTIVSNPNIPTFGMKSIHGDFNTAGSIGQSGFSGTDGAFDGISGVGYRPRPIIESVNIKNGKRGLSKKASIKIKCFTTKQLEEIAKYFNEPGFTLAVEWGWNTNDSLSQIKKDAEAIAGINDLDQRESNATTSKYQYDNFLGNITGGNISISDDTFELTVEATGLGDLALNLEMNQQVTCSGDNGGTDSTKSKSISQFIKSTTEGIKTFIVSQWTALNNIWERIQERDPNKIPFLEMYQNLPAEYQIEDVKDLAGDADVGPHYHYVGFNKEVRESLLTKGWMGLGGLIKSLTGWNTSEPSMNKVDLDGEAMIDEERFIRFGTLMKILDTANLLDSTKGITTKDGKSIKLEVNTKNVPIGAHRRIFSTNKTRLLILNSNAPDFGLKDTFTVPNRNDASIYVFLKNKDPMVDVTKDVPTINLLYSNTDPVSTQTQIDSKMGVFPRLEPLKEGIYDALPTTWGYLEDLYINFDFAVSIIKETGKLKKDAILDMVNGMSSAVNNMWDFQYVEEKADDSTSILSIVDMNFNGFKDEVKFPKFIHWGANSPFKNFSLDIDIPSAMKNQIIAKRLSGGSIKVNQSMPNAHPALWSQGELTDLVMIAMPTKLENQCKSPEPIKPKPKDQDILNKQSQEFVKKAGIFIKENDPDKIPNDLMDMVNKETLYVGTYSDTNILQNVRTHDLEYSWGSAVTKKPGVLLPVTVTFTIIGMSGIQFGHAFIVDDVFRKFAEGGVFQVKEIEHTLNGNVWETTVEAQFRPMVLG